MMRKVSCRTNNLHDDAFMKEDMVALVGFGCDVLKSEGHRRVLYSEAQSSTCVDLLERMNEVVECTFDSHTRLSGQ